MHRTLLFYCAPMYIILCSCPFVHRIFKHVSVNMRFHSISKYEVTRASESSSILAKSFPRILWVHAGSNTTSACPSHKAQWLAALTPGQFFMNNNRVLSLIIQESGVVDPTRIVGPVFRPPNLSIASRICLVLVHPVVCMSCSARPIFRSNNMDRHACPQLNCLV